MRKSEGHELDRSVTLLCSVIFYHGISVHGGEVRQGA